MMFYEIYYAAVKKKWMELQNEWMTANQTTAQAAQEQFQFHMIAAYLFEDISGKNLEVVSIGTGSTCVTRDAIVDEKPGSVLLNSHAEVIARRGLKLFLFKELISTITNNGRGDYFDQLNSGYFRLKPNKRLYLFISFPPCGSARKNSKIPDCNSLRLISIDSSYPSVRDPRPRRANSTEFYTCSDKFALYSAIGVQGALLSSLIESSITIESIIFPDNFTNKLDNLKMALGERIQSVNHKQKTPTIEWVRNVQIFDSIHFDYLPDPNRDFSLLGTGVECRDTFSLSHNWIKGLGLELTDGRTGRLYGDRSTQSRLTKRAFLREFRLLVKRNSILIDGLHSISLRNYLKVDYSQLKKSISEYQRAKSLAENEFQRKGLGRWNRRVGGY